MPDTTTHPPNASAAPSPVIPEICPPGEGVNTHEGCATIIRHTGYCHYVDQHPQNPPNNALGSGVTDDDLLEAIESSGYPLQSAAVDISLAAINSYKAMAESTEERMSYALSVQEEWSYEDPETKEACHLDALISAQIPMPGSQPFAPMAPNPQSVIRHHLTILMECKQSDLPFVFLLRPTPTGHFPHLVGLPHNDLSVGLAGEDPVQFLVGMSYFDALGLFGLPLQRHDRTAISMSRTYSTAKGSGWNSLARRRSDRSLFR